MQKNKKYLNSWNDLDEEMDKVNVTLISEYIEFIRYEDQRFKKSLYPNKWTDYVKRLHRELDGLKILEIDYREANFPIYPSRLKYIMRIGLMSLGLDKTEILKEINNIFPGTNKLPILKSSVIESADKIVEEYLQSIQDKYLPIA